MFVGSKGRSIYMTIIDTLEDYKKVSINNLEL